MAGYFRARDVRANIKELGYEKGLELSLTLLADEMVGIRQSMKSMAEIQNQFIDLLTQMGQVNGALAQCVASMQRTAKQTEESDDAGNIPTRNQ